MHLLGRQLLDEFMRGHADCRGRLLAWIREVDEAAWKGPQDIKERYASASFLAHNNVVFNIKGNAYRVLVAIDYGFSIVRVKQIDTHAGYDRW